MRYRAHINLVVFISLLLPILSYAVDSGNYINNHKVGYFDSEKEGIQFESVIDTLSIDVYENGFDFRINIIAPNFHQCNLEGEATKVNDHYAYMETLKTYSIEAKGVVDSECVLEFHIEGSEIYLLDKNLICRKTYCGQRGAFDGTRFNKK